MFKTILKTFAKGIGKHSPAILTGIGITGMAVATVLAVKSTPKAMELIEEKKKETDAEELTKKEVVETAWKCYIPTIILFAVSVSCVIFASRTNYKRNTALAGAYAVAEASLKDYKNYRTEVIKEIGEEKEKTIRDKVVKNRMEKEPNDGQPIVIANQGDILCYDLLSGRYFKSDINKMQKAVNELNRQLISEMMVSLNELYYELGLDYLKIGEELGWNIDDGLVELNFSSQLTKDGTPCIVLDFVNPPKYDFDRLF